MPLLLLPLAGVGGGILIAAYRRRRREDEAAGPEGARTNGVDAPATGAAAAAALAGGTQAGDAVAAATATTLNESGDAPLADPAIEEELEPIDEDAPLKKTRRAAKKLAAGTAMAAAPTERRIFGAPAKKGVSRARVGYRRVRISSEPDAVRSTELGRLDRGDEVEILESFEGFLQIRTPDDIVGWILRHTIVGAPS
jgi:SH3 domain-containing protein